MGAVGVDSRSSRLAWAWVAIGLSPIALGLALALAQSVDASFPEGRLVANVVAAVIAMIPPTAAILLGFLEGTRVSGRVALGIGSALMACVAFALITYVESMVSLVMAVFAYAVAMVAVLALAQSAARRRGAGRTMYPLA